MSEEASQPGSADIVGVGGNAPRSPSPGFLLLESLGSQMFASGALLEDGVVLTSAVSFSRESDTGRGMVPIVGVSIPGAADLGPHAELEEGSPVGAGSKIAVYRAIEPVVGVAPFRRSAAPRDGARVLVLAFDGDAVRSLQGVLIEDVEGEFEISGVDGPPIDLGSPVVDGASLVGVVVSVNPDGRPIVERVPDGLISEGPEGFDDQMKHLVGELTDPRDDAIPNDSGAGQATSTSESLPGDTVVADVVRQVGINKPIESDLALLLTAAVSLLDQKVSETGALSSSTVFLAAVEWGSNPATAVGAPPAVRNLAEAVRSDVDAYGLLIGEMFRSVPLQLSFDPDVFDPPAFQVTENLRRAFGEAESTSVESLDAAGLLRSILHVVASAPGASSWLTERLKGLGLDPTELATRSWSSPDGRADETSPAGSARAESDAVQQVLDGATLIDLLGRANLAGGLAGQLLGLHARHPHDSFAVLVAGAWGSGKSSLANLTLKALDKEQEKERRAKEEKKKTKEEEKTKEKEKEKYDVGVSAWIRPDANDFFDAWRESQIGPAWWSLLTWLRSAVLGEQAGRVRWWFRAREMVNRIKLAGLLTPAVVLVVLAGAVATYAIVRARRGGDRDVDDALIGIFGGLVTTGSAAVAVALVLSRWMTWRTPAGAKLFERRDDNPMEHVIAHSQWLRRQVDGPILLIVDDLDRCPASFVVQLLEAVQTLLRPISKPVKGKKAQPLVVVVCADDRWIHTAFEKSYAEFAPSLERPGRTLGQLFLAKLFQLQLRIPEVDAATAVSFSRHKLGLTEAPSPTNPRLVAEASSRVSQADSLDDKVDALRKVDSFDVVSKLALAVQVGRSTASTSGQVELHHHLELYIPMLDREPRDVVRFINAYALAKMGVGSLTHPPSNDALARWTVIELRWPSLARRLIAQPALLDRWQSHGVVDVDDHRDVIRSPEFERVVVGDDASTPALQASDIDRCIGAYTPQVAG